ncbi:6-phosphogluconolactonase (cycloisomerase 2 family) [Saccharopolyspora erythraea NRRL 2338]|uniref:Secreted protein n=3 Tax=Saccharopolyspora erythraea TaxID=1836 RepID=A4FKG7_SACEN|nr:lactonase family protein [Saccharopolyspora erythraea]PFG98179.1 6-phosphogluconolactonase (cycloisomerase 2 family) [Saccharopolyspora erythraea NRRL 2338]CAM04542.1 secreted protein [Saccharopolyspora erythraea NRRL 2338]
MRDKVVQRRWFLAGLGAAGAAAAAGPALLSSRATPPAQAASTAPHAPHAAAHPAMLMALIGSYTSSTPAGRGLDVAHRADSGALEPGGTVDGVPDASWLAWSPDHQYLYVTNETTQGTVTAVDLTSHTPKVINSQSSRGAGPTHVAVHPEGDFLFTANYTDGSVAVHRRNPDGGIGESTDLVKHAGAQPHAHQIVIDPSKRWVVAVDLGADSVYVHGFDHSTGKLTQNQQLVLPAGTGPRHLVFHPSAKHAYLLSELNSTITVLGFDVESGKFTPGQVLSSRKPGAGGENFPSEIAISRDTGFVYAANRGDNNIATFSVEEKGAKLSFAATAPTGGDWPRHFALDPEQTSVYVANQRSGTITRLARDPGTGLLTPAPEVLEVPSVAVITFHG